MDQRPHPPSSSGYITQLRLAAHACLQLQDTLREHEREMTVEKAETLVKAHLAKEGRLPGTAPLDWLNIRIFNSVFPDELWRTHKHGPERVLAAAAFSAEAFELTPVLKALHHECEKAFKRLQRNNLPMSLPPHREFFSPIVWLAIQHELMTTWKEKHWIFEVPLACVAEYEGWSNPKQRVGGDQSQLAGLLAKRISSLIVLAVRIDPVFLYQEFI